MPSFNAFLVASLNWLLNKQDMVTSRHGDASLITKTLCHESIDGLSINFTNEPTMLSLDVLFIVNLNKLLNKEPGPRFNIKMSSYQYRKSHCGDKTVVRSSYLHNGIFYTGKKTSLY